MNSLSHRTIRRIFDLVLTATLSSPVFSAFCQDLSAYEGTYRREPVENGWHTGTIRVVGEGTEAQLRWKNDAGVEWGLTPGEPGVLDTDEANPYYRNGARQFRLEMRDGKVAGFIFKTDFFVKEGFTFLPQKSAGFHGYISVGLESPPDEYGYGASFYVSIWPLVTGNLANFQIGLPSTWIIPDNRDFNEPLCPPGTMARDNWPERGPYYREVFQTIEGGLGYWGDTRFKSVTPKYRMNGTDNGYTHMISTPGWGPGRIEPLKPEQMGLAQLSNRLLVAPDGITFEENANGKLLGNAWMVLPITQAKDGPGQPTGDQSWTLFLNAANFKGPVAFFIPQTWSRLSQGYPTIAGRGLDARPARMGGGAMEVNTVPFFEATDNSGKTYTRIPKIQFPVNRKGETRLMQDITFYSKGAILPSGEFDSRKAWYPELTARPLRFDQGPQKVALQGFDSFVETTVLGTRKHQAFGLKWKKARDGFAALPEYFEQAGDERIAVEENQVPPETKLKDQEFIETPGDGEYSSPESGIWAQPGPVSERREVRLTDGSVVTYAWYRFVDQPSFEAFDWSAEEKERIQSLVERIHRQWIVQGKYLPEPSEGDLVALDAAIILTPPEGFETGYVPIALFQSRGE